MTLSEINMLVTYPNAISLETFPLQGIEFDENGAVTVFESEESRVARFDAEFTLALESHKESLRFARFEGKLAEHYRVDGGVPWITSITSWSNPTWEVNRMMAEKRWNELETLFIQFDSELVLWQTEQAKIKEDQDILKDGAYVRDLCDRAYNYVIGHNKNSNMAIEQLDQMEVDFAPIMFCLTNSKRPDKAYMLISQVTNPAYATLKEKLLQILAGG